MNRSVLALQLSSLHSLSLLRVRFPLLDSELGAWHLHDSAMRLAAVRAGHGPGRPGAAVLMGARGDQGAVATGDAGVTFGCECRHVRVSGFVLFLGPITQVSQERHCG